MTRAWFRSRLDTDPRRWVLLFAALEGLCAFALHLAEHPERLKAGPTILVWCAFAAIAPATGVVAMSFHGRLLWWTGKLLGGRARPEELHAAFAWAQLPFVVVAAPLVLAMPVAAARVQLDPTPPALRIAIDLLDAGSGVLVGGAALAALAGGLAYVAFVSEAQGFRWWRALANHLLALVAGLAFLAAAAAAGAWLVPGRAVVAALVASAALLTGVEAAVRAASRRRLSLPRT